MSKDTIAKIVFGLFVAAMMVLGIASGAIDKLDLDDMIMISGSME